MKTITKIIILAAVSAALAVVAEQLVAAAVSLFWQKETIFESYTRFTWFLAFSAAIEEISKYWAVSFVIRSSLNLKKFKFIFASFFLGIMWGIFEAGLIMFTDPAYLSEFQNGNRDIIFSLFLLVALHALTAFLMGASISAGIFSGHLKHLKILFFPVIIHLLFNFLLIQKSGYTNFLLFSILAMFFLAGIIMLTLKNKELA